MLPDRATAIRHKWAYHVEWIEDGKPCFVRCKSWATADAWLTKLKKDGWEPTVTDLTQALQLH